MKTPRQAKEAIKMFLGYRIKILKPEDKTDVFYFSSKEGDFKITIERINEKSRN